MTLAVSMDFKHLFVLASRAANGVDPPLPPETTKPLVRDMLDLQRFTRERDALVKRIVDAAPAAILIAAQAGHTGVDLLEFDGNDKFDGLLDGTPLLMIVKGPRQRELRKIFASTGTMPGLHLMRTAMSPFRVYCTWDRSTNANRVCVTWSPDNIRSAQR